MTEYLSYLLVFVVGFVSAGYGVSAGGGALLTVPFLTFMGLNPVHAVATSKLGSLGLSISGLWSFSRQGHVDWRIGWWMTALMGAGSLIGTYALVSTPIAWVKQAIAVMILFVLLLFFLFPKAGLQQQKTPPKAGRFRVGLCLTFLLGILTGFYQGGAGTMAAYIMILCFGQDFLHSAGTRKLPFLIANGLSLVVLIQHQSVHFVMGLSLSAGSFVGGYVGSRWAVRKGNRWVKVLFVTVVVLSSLRMLFV